MIVSGPGIIENVIFPANGIPLGDPLEIIMILRNDGAIDYFRLQLFENDILIQEWYFHMNPGELKNKQYFKPDGITQSTNYKITLGHMIDECEEITDEWLCQINQCYWYDNSCHSMPPVSCENLTNETDCNQYNCYWYNGSCHSIHEICKYIQDKGSPDGLTIVNIFEIIDAYILNSPIAGYIFIPTIYHVFGVIDYYLGFISSGNQNTGCNF